MPSKEYAIIVAGGSGTRMKSDLPKQFLLVNGKPVLMHTIEAFIDYSPELEMVLVLPQKDFNTWNTLCKDHEFNIPLHIVAGGKTRFQSVKNGLSAIGDEGIVAIHDGVRPIVEKEIIAASFNIARLHGSAIAAVRLKETIRVTDKDQTKTVDRSKYRLIQTPQTFQVKIIKGAYQKPESPAFTDDASVVEKMGYKISLFEGSYRNIKITTPEDIKIAEALLS